MFLIPYFLTVIMIELAILIYVSLKRFESKPKKNKIIGRKQETFNGFYIDR